MMPNDEYYKIHIASIERDMTWLSRLAFLFLVQIPFFVDVYIEKRDIAPLIYIAFLGCALFVTGYFWFKSFAERKSLYSNWVFHQSSK